MFCYVFGCPNANNGSKESKKARMVQIFFSAPEDESLFKMWQCAVPKGERVFTRKDKLCDFHFKKSEVILFNETKLPNGNVRRVPASEPKLKAGTIPSIFPEQKVSLNEDIKRTGSLQKSSNSEGRKFKQKRKLSTSDESDSPESPPPVLRSRGRPRKYPIGDPEKKDKSTFDKHRKPSLMQPSIRLVPLSTLLASSPTVPEQKPRRTVRMKSTGGPLLKKAANRKKAMGRNGAGPASAKKVKFADTELDESESVSDVHPEPVKPSQERKQIRKDLNRVEEELQNAIDDMNETYEIEHITDPGDTDHQDDEIFEIMSIKSDPDDLEHKKTLEELAAELAESGQVADPENINSSEADTVQEPRITQVISLRDLDHEEHPLLKKVTDVEPTSENHDIEREMAKVLGEESTSPEPLLLADSIPNTENLPVNDDKVVSESLINDQSSVIISSSESEAHINDQSSVISTKPEAHISDKSIANKPNTTAEALINNECAANKSVAECESSKNEESVATTTSEPKLTIFDESQTPAISEEPMKEKLSVNNTSISTFKISVNNESSVSKTNAESEVSTNDESFSPTSTISEAPLKDESLSKATDASEAPINNELSISKTSTDSEVPKDDESIIKTMSEPKALVNDESSNSKASDVSKVPINEESSLNKTSVGLEVPTFDALSASETTNNESSSCKVTTESDIPVNFETIVTKYISESETPESDEPFSVEGGVFTQISDKNDTLNVYEHSSKIEDNKESFSSDQIEKLSSTELAKETALDKAENPEETVKTKVPEEQPISLPFVHNTCTVLSNEELPASKDIIEFDAEEHSSVPKNIESATTEEPCRPGDPESPVKSTIPEEIRGVMEVSVDDESNLEMENSAEQSSEEINDNDDATVSEHLLENNILHTNVSANEMPEPDKPQKDLITKKKVLNKAGPRSRMSLAKKKKNKNAEVRVSKSGRKRRIKKHGESFSDDDLLSPSSPECVLDISSDSEADPNWAPNADAFEVSDDNDTDPECIGVDGESNTEKSSKTGVGFVKTSKTSNELANITLTSKSSKPTTTVPPEVSRILTQDTLQQILKTLKLPLDAPVSFNISDGAAADAVILPTELNKTYSNTKDKPISTRGRPPKVHLHNENIPGKMRQSRKVQISVERSKRCEKLLGIKMFEGLGKIKKAFDFSTFLTDADDELQFKKFCLLVRECLRDVCESKNAVTNIGKLTLQISSKTMKSQMPIPDLEPLLRVKDTAQPSSDASKRDSLPESTGDEAEMFECMTVDSNVENHYENTPDIENAMEEDIVV